MLDHQTLADRLGRDVLLEDIRRRLGLGTSEGYTPPEPRVPAIPVGHDGGPAGVFGTGAS